ncbi:MAG: cysteine desulfurase [Planctomycetaceae bacterium]|nr:cysteine desulfurase [Planctomycetaceae bacterium]
MSVADPTLPLDPERLRADFPILSTVIHDDKPLVYLDNAATTQRPRQVINALVNTYEKNYANVHRGIHWLSDQSTNLYEEARGKVQSFLNAACPQEIIFTSGTTHSINLVARSWGDANIQSGDEIILTEMEHHANLVPWQQLAERSQCKLRHIPITDDGLLCLESYAKLLNEKTKLVAFTASSNVLGTANPVRQIIQMAQSAGAKTLVDAAQSAPKIKTDVQELGADFLVFSGHKIMGPSGVGILYGRESLLEEMPPFLGGGSMIRRVYLDRYEPADLPTKFEAGTPPIVPAIGLGAAIDYLNQVGLDSIHQHEKSLTERAHAALETIGGIRFLGPAPEYKVGIVSFTVDGVHAHDVAQLLDREGIAIRAGHHCTMPLHERLGINASNRASFYLYNTAAEIDQMVAAVDGAKQRFQRKGRKSSRRQ